VSCTSADERRLVSIVARRHDVNANQLFGWRKQYERGQLGRWSCQAAAAPLLGAVESRGS